MNDKPKDLLLGAAKVLVVLSQFVMIFGMVMLGIGIGAMLTVGQAEVMAEIATSAAPPYAIWLIALAMLTGMVMLGFALRFLKELSGIIDSVDAGDPFQPENANRLNRMGWIAVIIQAAVLPIGALAIWFAPYFDKMHGDSDFEGGLDFGSILLTLILFILARVFRRGTEMREELEGTV